MAQEQKSVTNWDEDESQLFSQMSLNDTTVSQEISATGKALMITVNFVR